MTSERISNKLVYPSKYIEVNGSKMHYVEAGEGNPILFLHGVPTSSYIWRNIIPHLAPLGRCIAPDLIGFGKSDKPSIEYTIFDHINYIESFIKQLNLKNITLIMHGWGSVIGFHYAVSHEKNCNGLVFYEAFLRTLSTGDNSLAFQEQVLELSDESIYDAAVTGSIFVDKILPQNVMRELSEEEMERYREPFKAAGSAKPILQYLKELPNGNAQDKIAALIEDYSEKLTQSYLPKLMLYSTPGFITTFATAMWAKENLPNLEIADLGEELHLAQESCPDLMGEIISVWLQGVEQMQG
jgi:haloalkane dehalogenase